MTLNLIELLFMHTSNCWLSSALKMILLLHQFSIYFIIIALFLLVMYFQSLDFSFNFFLFSFQILVQIQVSSPLTQKHLWVRIISIVSFSYSLMPVRSLQKLTFLFSFVSLWVNCSMLSLISESFQENKKSQGNNELVFNF